MERSMEFVYFYLKDKKKKTTMTFPQAIHIFLLLFTISLNYNVQETLKHVQETRHFKRYCGQVAKKEPR